MWVHILPRPFLQILQWFPWLCQTSSAGEQMLISIHMESIWISKYHLPFIHLFIQLSIYLSSYLISCLTLPNYLMDKGCTLKHLLRPWVLNNAHMSMAFHYITISWIWHLMRLYGQFGILPYCSSYHSWCAEKIADIGCLSGWFGHVEKHAFH